ncbi:MAG: ISKra4 family transposase, partial [Anaerolineae bacterium]|nr:ISKra4 family transposase [Anaerolineae bacterium]
MEKESASLDALSKLVLARRQELTAGVTEALARQRHAEAMEQEKATCPQCGRSVRSLALVPRTVETMVGELTLERPYFYCRRCKQGFCPLDEALELSEHKKQWDIQEAGARLAAEVPFEEAQELFSQLTGMSLSNRTAHQVVGEVGQDLGILEVSPTAEEISQRIAEVAEGKKQPPIMVLALDGAHVPTRPEEAKGVGKGKKRQRSRRSRWHGEWKEAKGFRFYLVDEGRIVQVLSWHQIGKDEQIGEALRQVKEAGLIPEEKVRLCVVGDGAKWIWNLARELFPTAAEILDYYHLSERLHKVALAQFSDDPLKQRQWVEATKARLFFGYLDWVLVDLEQLESADEETGEEVRKLWGYLKENQGRVKYGSLRRKGYPLGSGGIESANKFISH